MDDDATHTVEVEQARTRFGDQSVERAMLSRLEAYFSTSFAPAIITVDGDTRFEVEAVDADRTIFVQLVANTGEFKSAHRNRVTANLFKLTWIRHALFPQARHLLCVTPTVTPALASTGWTAVASRDLGVDVLVYDPARGCIETFNEFVTAAHSTS